MKYKFLPHTADVKFQAFGKSPEEVFGNSALALFEILYKGKVVEKKEMKIKVSGKDFESLMYNFLEEFLVLFDGNQFLPCSIKRLKLDKKKFEIECIVLGDKTEDYKLTTQIKAITYNEMFVKKLKDKFISQVVVDV